MKVDAKTTTAFTLLEVIVVTFLIALVALIVLPALNPPHHKHAKLGCVNNLKQIGTAYRIWASDNGDRYPADVAKTPTNLGWADFAKMTNAGQYCWSNYALIEYELGRLPQILVCPADKRQPSDDFKHLNNKNISYFINPGASENFPLSILGGDRNVAPGTKPQNDYGYSPEDGSGNDVILQTNSPICWSLKMHSQGNPVGGGNILMGDGSVQQCSSARLMSDYQCTAVDAGNFPTGYINKSNSFRLIFP
ncbi:MAG: type secretion system protein [Verrucomicrobiales bacterium]|nr:type secretion system protein [Verrucomicrobiales bacterium]